MILTWEQLEPSLAGAVLAGGCFDLLTVGHIRHLKEALRFGWNLYVLVTADRYVNKGPNRPVYQETERVEMVDALRFVGYTVLNPYPTAVEAIQRLRPAVYCKGGEYRPIDRPGYRRGISPKLLKEKEAVEAVGGRLEFTEAADLHTSDIIERILHAGNLDK